MVKNLNYRALERVVKGYANHRRLRILELSAHEPDLTIDDFCHRLGIGYENASDHVRKMYAAGLLIKKSDGMYVRHRISNRGKSILAFCKKLI
jgi:DNA-binding transcriptional ArsR family regulator